MSSRLSLSALINENDQYPIMIFISPMLIAKLSNRSIPHTLIARISFKLSHGIHPQTICQHYSKRTLLSQDNRYVGIRQGTLTSKICYGYRSDDAYINMEKDYYAIL
jgi:hypothetical protein